MEDLLLVIAKRLGFEPETSSDLAKASIAWSLFGALYSVPLVLAGLGWLGAVADAGLLRAEWPILLLLALFLFLFKRLSFFFFIESPGDEQTRFNSTFEPIVTWSAVLSFGPTVLWIAVLADLAAYGRRIRRAQSSIGRLDYIRDLLHNSASITLVSLLALVLYGRWGGVVPIPGFTLDALLPALLATAAHVVLQTLLFVPMLLYVAVGWSPVFRQEKGWLSTLTWGLGITMVAIGLIELFAIMAAGLYVENGPGVYLAFLLSLIHI